MKKLFLVLMVCCMAVGCAGVRPQVEENTKAIKALKRSASRKSAAQLKLRDRISVVEERQEAK